MSVAAQQATKPNNPAAFPQHGWSNDPETIARMNECGGLTMRDYFAGQALIGFLSCKLWISELDKVASKYGADFKPSLATNCYEMADAMLRAREAQP